MSYRLTDHTADLGLLISGVDLRDLFANAAYALFDQLCESSPKESSVERLMEIGGEDLPDLLINWLRELLYFWNGEQLLLQKVFVKAVTERHLRATIVLFPHDPLRHRILAEIKAVTYHQVRVDKVPNGWEARVILDV